VNVEAARNERLNTTDQAVEPFLARQAPHGADYEARGRQTERGFRFRYCSLARVLGRVDAVLQQHAVPRGHADRETRFE